MIHVSIEVNSTHIHDARFGHFKRHPCHCRANAHSTPVGGRHSLSLRPLGGATDNKQLLVVQHSKRVLSHQSSHVIETARRRYARLGHRNRLRHRLPGRRRRLFAARRSSAVSTPTRHGEQRIVRIGSQRPHDADEVVGGRRVVEAKGGEAGMVGRQSHRVPAGRRSRVVLVVAAVDGMNADAGARWACRRLNNKTTSPS